MNKFNRIIKSISIFVLVILMVNVMKFGYKKVLQISEKKKFFVIGVSQANLYEPWRISMYNEIKEASKKYDNIRIIFKDAGGDTEKQQKDIEDLVNFGSDLLIISVNDSGKLKNVVKKVHKTTPVILLDRDISGYDYTLYIGPDNKKIGRQSGQLISNLSNGRKTNVIEIDGFLNSNPDIQRSEGLKEVLKKNNNISIERTIVAEWKKDEAYEKIDEILNEDKNINIIFAHSDYMALGAYEAILKNNARDIKIIGVDGISGKDGGINMVKNKILSGTFICPTGGKEAVDYAVKILKKERVPKKVVLDCTKVTESNVKDYMHK